MQTLMPPLTGHGHAQSVPRAIFASMAGLSALVLLLVLSFVLREAWPVLADGGWLRFFSTEGWHPLEGLLGLAPMAVATLAVSALALLLAVPLGLAGAMFERFLAPPAVVPVWRALVALLAGIPSVVYGLWGLTVLAPLIARWQPPGVSVLAGALVLALMVLPTVALTASSALAAVPASLLQGAAALGLSRRAVVLGVALPAARGGIVGGVLLAAARALGETMALLMVAGNVVQMPSGLFEPVRVLTANIALEMAYASGDHRAALFASGVLLTALVLALALTAGRVQSRSHHG